MTTQTNPDGTDPNSVWKVMNVQAPPAVAWRVFTEMKGTWYRRLCRIMAGVLREGAAIRIVMDRHAQN